MLLVVAAGCNASEGEEARTDPVGDPLPPGAVARMGKKRLRDGDGYVLGVGSVALSPDGKTLAFTSGVPGNFPTILWETATGKERGRITNPGGEGGTLKFSADGKFLMSLVSNAILFHDPVTTKELHRIHIPGGGYISFALSSDGASVVYAAGGRDTVTRDGRHRSGYVKVVRVELATGKELGQFRGDDGKGVRDFAISADGKTLIVQTSKDQKVHLWDTATGKERSAFARPPNAMSVVFSPDAKLVAWQKIGEEGTIRLCETTAGKELRQLVLAKQVPRYIGGHRNAVPVFSPDGKNLAATTGKTTCVWDVATGKELKRFQGDQAVVTAMGFSGDGNFLATGGDDTTVLIWRVREGKK